MIEAVVRAFLPASTALSFMAVMIWPAFVVAALLAAIGWRASSRITRIAAALWAVYGTYEALMHARVLCSGDCNIRIDLLVIYPILLIVTIAAGVSLLRRHR